MTKDKILETIKIILEKTTKKTISINIETDLIEDGILDSLDGMVFMLEIEQRFDVKFPEEIDLVEEGYYRLNKLVKYLKENSSEIS